MKQLMPFVFLSTKKNCIEKKVVSYRQQINNYFTFSFQYQLSYPHFLFSLIVKPIYLMTAKIIPNENRGAGRNTQGKPDYLNVLFNA